MNGVRIGHGNRSNDSRTPSPLCLHPHPFEWGVFAFGDRFGDSFGDSFLFVLCGLLGGVMPVKCAFFGVFLVFVGGG